MWPSPTQQLELIQARQRELHAEVAHDALVQSSRRHATDHDHRSTHGLAGMVARLRAVRVSAGA